MKDWSDVPSHHEQTLLPRSYILLLLGKKLQIRFVKCEYISFSEHVLFIDSIDLKQIKLLASKLDWNKVKKKKSYLIRQDNKIYKLSF